MELQWIKGDNPYLRFHQLFLEITDFLFPLFNLLYIYLELHISFSGLKQIILLITLSKLVLEIHGFQDTILDLISINYSNTETLLAPISWQARHVPNI